MWNVKEPAKRWLELHFGVTVQPSPFTVRIIFNMASFEKRSSYKLTNHQQVSLVVLPVVFNALALLFTCLRIYARRLKRAKVLADDYLCIAACVSVIDTENMT